MVPIIPAVAAAEPAPATRIDGGTKHGVLSMDAFRFGEIPSAAP